MPYLPSVIDFLTNCYFDQHLCSLVGLTIFCWYIFSVFYHHFSKNVRLRTHAVLRKIVQAVEFKYLDTCLLFFFFIAYYFICLSDTCFLEGTSTVQANWEKEELCFVFHYFSRHLSSLFGFHKITSIFQIHYKINFWNQFYELPVLLNFFCYEIDMFFILGKFWNLSLNSKLKLILAHN